MTIQGCQRRLQRAQEHIAALEDQVRVSASTNDFGTRRVLEQGGAHHVYVASVGDDLLEASILLSDCLHNLRSGLDNLVTTLAAANRAHERRSPLTEGQERRLSFPIYSAPEKFAGTKGGCLFAISERARDLIEWHQPYRCEYSPRPETSPIGRLAELQNIDKHRHLLMPQVVRGDTSIMNGDASSRARYEMTARVGLQLEDGDEIARFVFPQPEPDADVEYRPRLRLSVGEGPDIVALARGMATQVNTIFCRAFQLPELARAAS